MAKQPETPREWLEHFDGLAKKNAQTYQETGVQRYDDAAFKYDSICDAFRALIRENDERDEIIRKRLLNCSAAKKRLINDGYTRAEVEKIMDEAVWW